MRSCWVWRRGSVGVLFSRVPLDFNLAFAKTMQFFFLFPQIESENKTISRCNRFLKGIYKLGWLLTMLRKALQAIILIAFQRETSGEVSPNQKSSVFSRSVYFMTMNNNRLHGYVVERFQSASLLLCNQKCLRREWCAWTKWKNRNLWAEQAQLFFRFRKREFTRKGWSYFLPTRKGNSLQENYFRW